MSNTSVQECDENNACNYFIAIPGGDSLLCKPYRREQFYGTTYPSCTCGSFEIFNCKQAVNKPPIPIIEQGYPCRCNNSVYYLCPALPKKCLRLVSSSTSLAECGPCSCSCDQPKLCRLPPADICRLSEMVDESSSVSDLKKKKHCKCPPIEDICLKTVLKKCVSEENSVEELTSLVATHSNGCKPCRRKLKQQNLKCPCREKEEESPRSAEEKEASINLRVEVKQEEKCPVYPHKRCKCKHKKKKEKESKMCRCCISPPIVICDKQPEEKKPEDTRSLLQSIKSMVSKAKPNEEHSKRRQSKQDKNHKSKEDKPVESIDEKPRQSKVDHRQSKVDHPQSKVDHHHSVTANTVSRKSSKRQSERKLSKIKEQSSSSSTTVTAIKSEHSKSKSARKISSRNERRPSKKQSEVEKQEMGKKSTTSNKRKSTRGDLNAIFVNKQPSLTDRSVILNAEEKIVQYMFTDIYKQLPLCVLNYGLQNVSYNLEYSYKSLLKRLDNVNTMLKLEKSSMRSIRAKAMKVSFSYTKIHTNDKFSQVTGFVEHYEDNDKNFLNIVKKFETYKTQQWALENGGSKQSFGYYKTHVENSNKDKKNSYFTKPKSEYFGNVFCNIVAPIIYLTYLVIFIWVTFPI